MHQAIPPAPSPHGNCGGGALASFCAYRGSGIYQPRGHLRALDTHVVSYSTITTKRILLEKQADWPICQGREKIEEGCKGISRFYACISSLLIKPELHIGIWSYLDANQRFLVNREIKIHVYAKRQT